MIKKLFSYILPVNVFRKKSEWSKNLEVTWNNGELVLDSENTNYSYGSLQRILRKGLKTIGFDKVKHMEHILVLGVAGGSVIKTIVNEIGYTKRITGVEIDAEVIAMANTYFKLNEIQNLDIIIDIFQDTTMPNFLFESFFTKRVGFLLNDNGILLFNTMLLNSKDNIRNEEYIKELASLNFHSTVIPRVEQHNELIIAYKKP